MYDNDSGDPAENAAAAAALLRQAAGLAAQLGELLEQAQSRINSQGYRTPEES